VLKAIVNLKKNGVFYRNLVIENQNAQYFGWTVRTDLQPGTYSIRVISGDGLVSDERVIIII